MPSTNEPQFEIIRTIRFPPPPPTHNSLTPSQRAQLLRKTRKLEQILGATPHLLDEALAPVHITFPSGDHTRSSEDSFFSYSSGSSSASSSACPSPTSSLSSSSLSSSSSHKRRGSLSSLTRVPSTTLRKSPPPRDTRDGPRLRLADHITAPKTAQELSNPTPSTAGAARKSKMDRIRKRLGEGVPVELVFPDGDEDTVSCDGRHSLDGVVLADFPTPRVPKTKHALGTIAGARNSLVEVNKIHKAPRTSTSSSSSSSTRSPSSLGKIIESPDEHGSGYSYECKPLSSDSKWSSAEIKLWSTRQGYEGWPPTKKEKRSSWSYRKHDLVSFIDVGA